MAALGPLPAGNWERRGHPTPCQLGRISPRAVLTLPRGKDHPGALQSSSCKAPLGLVMSCWWGPKLVFLPPWCHQEVPLPSPGAPWGCCLLLLFREASPSHLWTPLAPLSPLVFPLLFHRGFSSTGVVSRFKQPPRKANGFPAALQQRRGFHPRVLTKMVLGSFLEKTKSSSSGGAL